MALDTSSTKTTRVKPMTATCPQGHTSSTDDFCDVCGEPIAGTSVPAADPAASAAPSAPSAPATRRVVVEPRPAVGAGRADRSAAGVPELRRREPARRVVLRAVRVRLHDRPAPRRRATAGRDARSRVGRRAVDRSRLVRRAGRGGNVRHERRADGDAVARHRSADRARVEEPQRRAADRLLEPTAPCRTPTPS